MTKRRSYEEESAKLVQASEIAIESFRAHLPKDLEEEHLEHIISVYESYKNDILNPEPQFKSMASLRISESDVFTIFQESSGETVNYFWRRIGESNLNYKRTNKLGKIFKRGKIKGVNEYDYVKDVIVAAEQEGLTTPEQTILLSQMLDGFERK